MEKSMQGQLTLGDVLKEIGLFLLNVRVIESMVVIHCQMTLNMEKRTNRENMQLPTFTQYM